ncbi:efflux RND transporter periplasmic adaptor subunit [Falsirhodobacter xinxiangensis]|uniref:efflux RND transporter periplasmic adaptor subunit n=1 Tax=Falsirhodobacter xinxiangensis TaxID=2530049 RepID=UPI001C7073F4|nr:efflux RND transporter periplasmic adaptor subunit [Rhodobacter xinxiangensis]
MKKKFWITALAAAVLLGGWWFWQGSSGEAAIRPATYKVARGDVTVNVLASGQVESSNLVSVGAQVSGTVETLAVRLGDKVAEGDLIAQIDNLDQKNDVRRAEAELAQIDAQIAAKNANERAAQLAFERQVRLRAQGNSYEEALETAEANLDVLKAEIEQLAAQKTSAEIAVATAQTALDRTSITAPINGTVVAIVTQQGQTVNANQSTPTIVKLADLENMVVKAEISEADVVRVKSGQDVTFSILGDPERVFEASVRAIEPAPAGIKDADTISTEEAIYYNGLFDVENPDGQLRIGMTAEVTIALAAARDVLIVPSAALGARSGQGYTVSVYDPATQAVARRAIVVGMNNNVSAEVISGLEEGEQILASGAAEGLASAARNPRGRPMGF